MPYLVIFFQKLFGPLLASFAAWKAKSLLTNLAYLSLVLAGTYGIYAALLHCINTFYYAIPSTSFFLTVIDVVVAFLPVTFVPMVSCLLMIEFIIAVFKYKDRVIKWTMGVYNS